MPGVSQNHHLNLKQLGAVWLGKALIGATRISGRGGTTLPGRTALRFFPDLLPALAGQLHHGNLLVTGTNGKTTTSTLLTGILKRAGYRCVHNQSGSNMSWGVASSLIGSSSWKARLPGDIGVMEVDEGAFPALVEKLQPRGVVVTNIFRDQLDRYGEVDHIQKAIGQGLHSIPDDGFMVLNADDPSLTSIEAYGQAERWYYGLELELPPDRSQNTGRDIKSCPRCHQKLHFDQVYFAHLGRYRCLACDFKRPEPDVKLTRRTLNSDGTTTLELLLRGEPLQATYPLLGTYNLYNALAAVTCAAAMGISMAVIKTALEGAEPSFGRMERFIMEERSLLMALIKNPVGANEVLRTVIEQQSGTHLLIAINDKVADGTDVSWLWDVDFEQLAGIEKRLSSVTVTGARAWDMAVRLKYAGLPPASLRVETNMKQAVLDSLGKTPPGEILFILPNYTAMLEMRRMLNRMGVGRPYWEGT